MEKICLNCGKAFEIKKASEFNKRNFCSRGCSAQYHNSEKSSNKIEVKCAYCGKKELVHPSRAKTYKCCSIECLGKYNSKRYKRTVAVSCVVCGAIMEVKPSHAERRKTCSKDCSSIYLSSLYRGELNPNYKSGKSAGKSERGRRTQYTTIVKNELGIKEIPKGLDVHHKDANPTNNSIENLILLPRDLHSWIHKEFGSAVLKFPNLVEQLIGCTSNPKLAQYVYINNISTQRGVVKSGELLETLNETISSQAIEEDLSR